MTRTSSDGAPALEAEVEGRAEGRAAEGEVELPARVGAQVWRILQGVREDDVSADANSIAERLARLPHFHAWRHRDGGFVASLASDSWQFEAVFARRRRDRYGVLEPFRLTLKRWPKEPKEGSGSSPSRGAPESERRIQEGAMSGIKYGIVRNSFYDDAHLLPPAPMREPSSAALCGVEPLGLREHAPADDAYLGGAWPIVARGSVSIDWIRDHPRNFCTKCVEVAARRSPIKGTIGNPLTEMDLPFRRPLARPRGAGPPPPPPPELRPPRPPKS